MSRFRPPLVTAPLPPLHLASALAGAAAAFARLDQALAGHPLAPAFLYRARLEAVRRMAAVDGQLIDPWHLAAVIEGLRLRMDPALRIIERGDILEKARFALSLHQWLVEPDGQQESEIQRAAARLTQRPAAEPPLLAAAAGLRRWLAAGETRPPMRAALTGFWRQCGLLRLPVPLTGAAALGAGQSWDEAAWLPAFLQALECEAADSLALLLTMERAWIAARQASAGRRKDSHVSAAIDLLAAAPLLSAATLARSLGLARKSALRILEALQAAAIVIEVTHRSKRRLFGLAGLAPLRERVRPPYRPVPGRRPGRPRADFEPEAAELAPPPLPPLSPLERRQFDYAALDAAMAHLDAVLRDARIALRSLAISPEATGRTEAADPAETAPGC
ncbi:hypothetical protein [Acidocella facilis]|uniref:hypothetical protein n=1 Tax=Acidocella facilis TaxID=525 RepID=UPI001F32BE9D|nr:hypothetical protein [Acidocella facilis]